MMEKIKEKNKNKNGKELKSEKEGAEKSSRPRLLRGEVINDSKDKTINVLVNRYKLHPKYRKRHKVGKKYLAHDPENKYQKGDRVIIKEVRPISKKKKWLVIDKVSQ